MDSNNPIDRDSLLVELKQLERKGTSLWIEGDFHTPEEVTDTLCVREGPTYMRDYIFEENKLTELRFDRIDRDGRATKKQKKKPKPYHYSAM